MQTRVVYREFAKLWNRSDCIADVSRQTGQTKHAAAVLACRMRKLGWKLKMMPCNRERGIAIRLMSKVLDPSKCWSFTGHKSPLGYGRIQKGKRGGKPLIAHRVSYELFIGKIKKGMMVLHRCDNPSCVNPAHLFLGTAQDNVDDMIAKGRGHWQGGARKRKGA